MDASKFFSLPQDISSVDSVDGCKTLASRAGDYVIGDTISVDEWIVNA